MITIEYDPCEKKFPGSSENKFNDGEVEDAINVLKGIVYNVVNETMYGYVEGNRNDLAVDLSIACYILNQDQFKIGDKILKDRFSDQYDLGNRLEIIDGYLDSWYMRSRKSKMLTEFGTCSYYQIKDGINPAHKEEIDSHIEFKATSGTEPVSK